MIRFVDCTLSSLPAVREFWLRAYGPNHVLGRDAALFQWQFGPNAGGVRAISRSDDCFNMKLAMDGQRVVGCLGFIPVEVSVLGESKRGCWLANWMVDSDYARVGVGPLLLREVISQVEVVVNVGISDEARGLLRRMRWLDLGTMNRWVRVLHKRGADSLLPEGMAHSGTEAEDEITFHVPRGLHQVHAFGEQAARLWHDCHGVNRAGVTRSTSMLNWRYADHPTFCYELLELRYFDRLVGVAVYRIEEVREPSVRIGRIVELFGAPSDQIALVAAVCDHAMEREVVMLDFFSTGSDMRSALDANGFLRGDEGIAEHMPQLFQPIDRRRAGIACMIHSPGVNVPTDSLGWYATKGDADQDRPN